MHPWVKGVQFSSNEGPHLFPRGDNYEKVKLHWRKKKIFFSRTTGPISTKLGTMPPWVIRNQVCSNKGPRPFPMGDNNEIAKIHWRNLNIFFSRTAGLISTKLDTKHPASKCKANEGPRPFPRGDNDEVAKIHWHTLNSSSPEPLGQIQPKLAPWLKGSQDCLNEGDVIFKGEIIMK